MDNLSQLQKLLAKIPRGKVTTYKDLAKAMGMPKAVRAVGTLCGKNPEPDRYPCCKVVRSDGSIGKYAMGTAEKIRRLKAEGIEIKNGKIVSINRYKYSFSR